jgi:hypothetical protein
MGELDNGLQHADVAITNYNPHPSRVAIRERGLNAGVSCRCFTTLILMLRGYPHIGRQRLDEAMVLAQDDPYRQGRQVTTLPGNLPAIHSLS